MALHWRALNTGRNKPRINPYLVMQKAQVIKNSWTVTVFVTVKSYDGLNKIRGGPS